jgi:hypothetical protein
VIGGALPLLVPEPQAVLAVKTMSRVCMFGTDGYCRMRTRGCANRLRSAA